jgi:predicted ATPase/DNA-binding SARP family transcriptional activator
LPVSSLTCFGSFKAENAVGVVSFHGRKTAALLVYLVLEADRAHSRASLAALFWPELPEESARNNLRVALARLSSSFGSGWLETNRQNVQLSGTAGIRSDVLEFQELLTQTQSHAHIQRANCTDCYPKLMRAVQVYRGEFLEGFALPDCPEFEEWLLVRREQYQLDVLGLLADLSAHAQHRGDLAAAEQYTRQQLRLEPLRELACRDLMRLLALQGKRNEALEQFRAYRTLLEQELGIDPEAQTLELAASIERGDALEPVSKVSSSQAETPRVAAIALTNNLPAEVVPFIGRESELTQLQGHLRKQRLITVLGMAGIGKTRLAITLARSEIGHFADGVFLVRLAAAQNLADMLIVLAQAIGLRLEEGSSIEAQVLEHLKGKEMLLVLDNFEQLISARTFLTELLRDAPGLKVLVTSRQKLGLSGEAVYALSGLDVLESRSGQVKTATEALQSSAVQLFIETGQRVRLGLEFSAPDLLHIQRICQLVDGHPLALMLAASWLETISCALIAEQLSQGLQLLETDSPDLPAAHRSISAALEQSWGQLSEEEQQVLMRLAVFRGGFDRKVASTVAQASIKALSNLVSRSFVQYWSPGQTTDHQTGDRYDLHELIAQFARQKLEASSELEDVRQAHAQHYLSSVAQWEAQFKTDPVAPLLSFQVDFENLRLAWRFALERQNVQLLGAGVGGLGLFCTLLSRHPILIEMLEPLAALLRQAPSDGAPSDGAPSTEIGYDFELGILLALAASYRSAKGYDTPELVEILDRAYQISGHIQTSPQIFPVLFGLFIYNLMRGEYGNARQVLQEWRKRIEAADNCEEYLETASLILQTQEAVIAFHRGQFGQAREMFETALAKHQPALDHVVIATYGFNLMITAQILLAVVQLGMGYPEQAFRTVQQAVTRSQDQPDSQAQAKSMLAHLYFATGDLERFRQVTAEVRHLTATHQIKYVAQAAECFDAIILSFSNLEAGTVKLEQCLQMMLAIDLDSLGVVLAENHLKLGHADQAMTLLNRILAATEPVHLERNRVEVLRVKGQVLLHQGQIAQAEAQLRAAIALAQVQETRLFELRAIISLSRLLADDGRHEEAHTMLEAVYAGFSEGFETEDLQEAARVLKRLEVTHETSLPFETIPSGSPQA